MAVRDGVDENRLRRCASDYDKKHAAWDALLEPHVKGFFEKLGGGSHMPLQFDTPLKPEWLAFEQVYRAGGFFQTLLNGLADNLDLPEDVPVIVKGCGVENAWWSPETKTITLCHDFSLRAYQHLRAPHRGRGPNGGGGGGGSTATASSRRSNHRGGGGDGGGAPGGDLTQALVGQLAMPGHDRDRPSDRERQFPRQWRVHGQFGLGERLDDERLGHLAAGRL